MKKLSALLLGASIIFGSAVVSEAQLRTGTQEMGFSGVFDDNGDRTWSVQGYWGYFYNPQLEFLAIGNLQGGSGQSTRGKLGPGFDWHFTRAGTDNFVPFAGAAYLIGLGSGEPDFLGAHIGLKQFLARSTAVRYQIGYGFDPSETSDSTFRATVGLSFFF
jgi:hypothetical protein